MGQSAPGSQGARGERGEMGPPGPPGKNGIITWGTLSDDQKSEIMTGLQKFPELRGPKGDQGPPGDPEKVATSLAKNVDFPLSVADKLSTSKDFKDSISGTLLNEGNIAKFTGTIYDRLSKDTTFQDTLSDRITGNKDYARRLKGDPGDLSNYSSIKSAIGTKSLWCADGEFCKIPSGYWNDTGTQTIGNVLGVQFNSVLPETTKDGKKVNPSQRISFGDNAKGFDTKNGLAHRIIYTNEDGTFKLPQDGPFLYGSGGGQLGTVQTTNNVDNPDWTLKWDNTGRVDVKKTGEIGGVMINDGHIGYSNNQNSGGWKSEISNDTSGYKKLMIIGNKANDANGPRRVGIWDRLDVHGHLGVDGGSSVGGNSSVGGESNIGGNVILGRNNKWILHTPGDGRVLHITSLNKNTGDWDWGSQVNIQPHQLEIGHWKLNTSDGHLRMYYGNDLKYTFQNDGNLMGQDFKSERWNRWASQ